MSIGPMFGDDHSAVDWMECRREIGFWYPYFPSDVQWEVARQMNCDWVRLRNQEITITQMQDEARTSRAGLSSARAELVSVR